MRALLSLVSGKYWPMFRWHEHLLHTLMSGLWSMMVALSLLLLVTGDWEGLWDALPGLLVAEYFRNWRNVEGKLRVVTRQYIQLIEGDVDE